MADINTYFAKPCLDSPERMDRHNELAHWSRATATDAARREGIELDDALASYYPRAPVQDAASLVRICGTCTPAGRC